MSRRQRNLTAGVSRTWQKRADAARDENQLKRTVYLEQEDISEQLTDAKNYDAESVLANECAVQPPSFGFAYGGDHCRNECCAKVELLTQKNSENTAAIVEASLAINSFAPYDGNKSASVADRSAHPGELERLQCPQRADSINTKSVLGADGQQAKTSAKDLNASLESQIVYLSKYTDNLSP